MRVFSQSQGKVIDVPDSPQVSGGQGMGSQPGNTNISSKIKPALLTAAFSDPKHMSTYTNLITLLDKVYPEEEKVVLKGKSANDVNFARNVITAAQTASKKYDPNYTGPLQARGQELLTKFNLGKPGFVGFKQNLADIRTAVRNYVSGTAVSEAEAKELEALIPKDTDSDQKIQEKLLGIQQTFMNKVQNTLATSGSNQTAQEYLGTEPIPTSQQNSGGGVMETIKELTVNPLARSVKNIGTEAITVPQALLAKQAGYLSPQLGAQIANKDILGTQKSAGEISENPTQALTQQALDSLTLYGTAQGIKGVSSLYRGGKEYLKGSIQGGKNVLRSSTEKVGEKEAASLATRKGQTISRKSFLSLYDDAAEQTNVSLSGKNKLLSTERKRLLDYFPEENIPIEKATEKLRGIFSAQKSKNATSLVKARNEAARNALQQLMGSETGELTKEYVKAYGTQKLKGRIGNQVLSTAISLPVYYLLAKLLSPIFGGSGTGNPRD